MTSFTRILAFGSALALLTAIPLSSAFAAGSGSSGAGSGNTGGSGGTSSKKTCKKGEVVKLVLVNGKKKKKCVKPTAGVFTDDELYEQGSALAKDGEYEWALQVLALVQNQSDPKVLNYIGYSHRKAGRIETGVSYYRKALQIDPNFVLAREYLGEGYVAAGRVDLAQLELAEIGKRCGVTCTEYTELAKVIASASN